MVWSLAAEAMVRRILTEPEGQLLSLREQGERLAAVPLGYGLWSAWFLRPNGEVVSLGEDENLPDEVRVYSDRLHQVSALTWLSRRHTETASLLPKREAGAVDCRCVGIPAFAPGKVICQACGGVGWLPASDAEVGAAPDASQGRDAGQ